MKILFIALLFIAACSTKNENKSEPVKVPIESPTESSAKPVSPYTVKPCYCMKIFRPVCAEGSTFGNSCEAECQGYKTWQEGPCVEKKE